MHFIVNYLSTFSDYFKTAFLRIIKNVSFTLVPTPVLLGADSKQPLGADSWGLSFVLLLFNCSIEIV